MAGLTAADSGGADRGGPGPGRPGRRRAAGSGARISAAPVSGGPASAFPSTGQPGRTMIQVVSGGQGRPVRLEDLAAAMDDPSTLAWVDLTEPTLAHLADVAAVLGLHPLMAENVGERAQRAKIEQVDDLVQIVLFAVDYSGEVHPIEVDFVLGPRFLLSVHASDWDPMAAPQLRSGPDPVLARGPDYLFYAFGDWIVDGYFPVLDRLADEIDQLQEDVIEKASPWTLQRLFTLKRELIGLRRATSPAREIFNQLTNREIGLVRAEHVVYLRDVYDHLLRVTDELDNYRELVSGTLEVYLSTINNNLSVIMKRLTGVTVLLAGVGAIAGIFGMSEAGSALNGAGVGGFWAVAIATVAVAAVAALMLRRSNWI